MNEKKVAGNENMLWGSNQLHFAKENYRNRIEYIGRKRQDENQIGELNGEGDRRRVE